ncbi:MAG: NADP-dependent isocitrate dehydrogenase, partial [Gammaproteobacteria bacterium]|nr:NADP-dependent isocitrate dehydrogenase [Gammaproteobacteria bacterium]
MTQAKIIYTYTDEAPALATHSLLPVIEAFTRAAGVTVETRDISLAARIIANFPDNLTDEQKQSDALSELGNLAKTPEANIIKLPNISASIPQLKDAIAELQSQGYDIPDYPEEAGSAAEKDIQSRYAKVLGSAVNPVLREGNSDRRVADAVKQYAKKHPHRLGEWSADCRSHVAHMSDGDFYGSEQSVVMDAAGDVRIEYVAKNGDVQVLKQAVAVQKDEVIDCTRMSKSALRQFFAEQVADARTQGVLLSLHLKATMMKISDPIMFGHAVETYFADLFTKHASTFDELGVDARNGFGDVVEKIAELPAAKKAEIEAEIQAIYDNGPAMAMVDSDRGITNLHVPNDIIIDASMPAALRSSGQ